MFLVPRARRGLESAGQDRRGHAAFPGIPDAYAVETFAEFSLATLNGCRGDRQQLDRLASIWHGFVERIFATPLARLLGSGLMLKLLAKPVAQVLQRQPAFQPLNFKELQVIFPARKRCEASGLGHLSPRAAGAGHGPIADLLRRKDAPFDLYQMMLSERA